MVKFTGYAKQDDPKWFSLLVTSLIILVVIFFIFGATYFNQWLEKKAESKAEKPVTTTTTTSTTTSTTTTAELPATTSTHPIVTTSTTLPERKEKPVASRKGVTIERIVLASRLEANLPADELNTFSRQGYERIYGCTRIAVAAPPAEIHHVWIDPEGIIYADITLTIRAERLDTWSYITISRLKPGRWQLLVKSPGGEIVARKDFSVN